MAADFIRTDPRDVGLVGFDDAGMIRLASPRICAALGYRAEELVGSPLTRFLDTRFIVHPSSNDLKRDTLVCRSRTGQAVPLHPSGDSRDGVLHVLAAETPVEAPEDDLTRLLFERSPLPMFISDRETGRFLAVNEAMAEKYRLSRDDFLLKSLSDLNVPDASEGELRVELSDGKILRVELTSRDLHYLGRDARLTVCEDITAREEARSALHQSEEQHRRLVELSPDLVLILHQNKIVFINAAGANILGASTREEMLGRSFLELVQPDARDVVRERLRQIVDEGLSISLVEEQLLRVDGTMRSVELVAIPFVYHDLDAALMIARDVTERRASDDALQRSVSLLQSTLDSSADGVMVLDSARMLISYNARLLELWGADPVVVAENPQSVLEAMIRSLDAPSLFLASMDRLSADPDLEAREELRLKNGRALEVFSLPHRLDGRSIGRVWSFRDVTERRRTEEALARRDAILQAVAFAAERFLTSNDWHSSLGAVIARLGAATDANVVTVVEVASDGSTQLRYRWPSAPLNGSEENPSFDESLLRRVKSDEVVARSGHPATADREENFDERVVMRRSRGDEQAIATSEPMQRLVVPINTDAGVWGFLSFDAETSTRQWTPTETDALRAAAQTLGASIQRRLFEEDLRRSEERFRRLFERNLAGVYRNTLDGRILDCNDSCARILGYSSRAELMERHANESYFAAEQRDMMLEQLKRTGSLSNVELCLKRADGRAVWVLENVMLIDGPEGERILEGTIIDISDRKRAEEGLRQSEERYRLMADNTTDMLSRLSSSGVFVYVSPACRLLLGYDSTELVGRSVTDLVHPDDREELSRSQKMVFDSSVVHTIRARMRRADDTYVWVETSSRSVQSLQSGEFEMISVSRDISERKRAEELIEYQAYHDPLTGLPNRMMFSDRLTLALSRARRLQRLVAVMFLDLDHFKVVNDTLGHTSGDQLLRDVAARLRSCVRQEDTLARIGGDEFTLLLFELEDKEVALKVGEKILGAFERPFALGGERFHVTSSIGIALFPHHGESPESLLRAADAAMYAAKSAGRNRIVLAP